MSDIVERLRAFGPDWTIKHAGRVIPYEVCAEAADEIERLQTCLDQYDQIDIDRIREIERLRDEIKELRAEIKELNYRGGLSWREATG